MFKRLFWLMVGAGFGFGVSFWLTRFVRQTIDRLASVRGTTSDALAELTANNTRRLFGLAMADPHS